MAAAPGLSPVTSTGTRPAGDAGDRLGGVGAELVSECQHAEQAAVGADRDHGPPGGLEGLHALDKAAGGDAVGLEEPRAADHHPLAVDTSGHAGHRLEVIGARDPDPGSKAASTNARGGLR